MAYKKRIKKRRRNRKKLVTRLFATIAIIFVVSFLTAFGAGTIVVASVSKDLAKLADNPIVIPAQTTKIYAYKPDGTSQLLTNLFVDQDRVIIPLNRIPLQLQQAVIAIEDERFYQHRGVDFRAIARALATDISEGKVAEGGSTITQQYIKNVFLTSEKTINRKLKEAILAYRIEKTLSKEKILELYLNTIYFGQSSYGIETAAHNFFGKSAKDLTLTESALLAGVIRAPNDYSPYTYPEKAKPRRDLVLTKMFESGYISEKQLQAAINVPIKVAPQKPRSTAAPYFVEYVKQILIKKYGANMVFKGGLRVYTTLDLRMQEIAEKTVPKILNRPDDPSASLVAIEPRNGYIKALVGGSDFDTQKYNIAIQGKRQPGSAFKTFVLAAAIEKGISISKSYPSNPTTISLPGKDWVVRNATEGTGGRRMSLREATIKSVNAVFARLVMDTKPENVVTTARKMGITSHLDPFPSIALGGLRFGVTPLEMASAYATLANNGNHVKPTPIIRITDAEGKIIEEYKPVPKLAINSTTAYLVTDILKGVIRSGTGRAAAIRWIAAGKTGTTQEYGDAWFVGYTPHLSTSVWVGHRDSKKPMKNVHGIRVAGGTFPARIWQAFMSEALRPYPRTDFQRPSKGLYQVRLCTVSDKKARPYCPTTYVATFLLKQGPASLCDIHISPPPVTVGNFIGLTEAKAKELAKTIGLTLSIKYKVTDEKAGIVVAQSPPKGASVKKGSAVNLVVTVEKPSYPKLMNVVGMSKESAEQGLKKAGFIVSVGTREVDDPSQVGKVIEQSPQAGTELQPGSTVTVVIGIESTTP